MSKLGKLWDVAKVAIPAVASWLGGRSNNDANKKEAQKNRDFQEDMSNTAVQRSVEDYEAAGLNPSLAYDRSASSPSGNVAGMEDALSKGVSNALSYKQQKEANEIAKATSLQNIEESRTRMAANMAASGRDLAAGKLADAQANQAIQTLNYNLALNPKVLGRYDDDSRMAELDRVIKQLSLPGLTNAANFSRMMGTWEPGIKYGTGALGDVIGLTRGVGGVVNAFRKPTPPTFNNFRLNIPNETKK